MTSSYREQKARQADLIREAIKGDEVIMDVSGGAKQRYQVLAPITKVTKTQIVVGDEPNYRFYRFGQNRGREVGSVANRSMSMYRIIRTLVIPENDAEKEAVRKGMAASRKAELAKNAKAAEAKKVKEERRAARFEGSLMKAHKELDALIVEDGDEIMNKVLRLTAERLWEHVWKIENNEESLKQRVASERKDLQGVTHDLDADCHIHFVVDREIPKLIEERKTLIEEAKKDLYLAYTLLGNTEEAS